MPRARECAALASVAEQASPNVEHMVVPDACERPHLMAACEGKAWSRGALGLEAKERVADWLDDLGLRTARHRELARRMSAAGSRRVLRA